MKVFYTLACVAAALAVGGITLAQSTRSTSTTLVNTGKERKYSFALVSRDGNISCWGNWDTDKFRDLRDRSKEDTLYVKKGDEMYAITDAQTVNKSKTALKPMQELGREQGKLGELQGDLGREQGRFGEQQAALGKEISKLSRQLAETARSGEPQKEIVEQINNLSERMKDLGKQQKALGERQKELGKRQSELGKKQCDAAVAAEEKITKLIDDAFARGLAKKIQTS
jgi:bla regulator protein blaR1